MSPPPRRGCGRLTIMFFAFSEQVTAVVQLWNRGDLTAEAAMRAITEAVMTLNRQADQELSREQTAS